MKLPRAQAERLTLTHDATGHVMEITALGHGEYEAKYSHLTGRLSVRWGNREEMISDMALFMEYGTRPSPVYSPNTY